MNGPDAKVLRRLVLGAVLLAIVGGAATVYLWRRPTEMALPTPDLSETPPLVQQEFEKLRADLQWNLRSPEHWGRMGMFLMAHHHATEAGACLRRAAEYAPDEFRWRYYQAVLLEETDMCLAADAYATALQVDDGYLPARLRYATVLVGLNRLEEARQQYAEVMRRAPQEHYACLGLARLALAAGDWDEAARLFASAVERAPWSRDAHGELARVAILRGDADAALREHQLASRMPQHDSRWPDPLLGAVEQFEAVSRQLASEADQLMLRGDTAGAVAAFRELIEARPEMPRPLLNLGQTLWSAGRAEEAVEVYQELVRRFPDIAEGYFNLALALETLRRPDEALASYQKCVARKPDYFEAHFAMGLLLERQERRPEAIEAYRRAVAAGPQFAPAHLALAVALKHAGQREEALRHAELAVRLAPGDPVPRKYLDELRGAPGS